jgi:hypothetical protein
MVLFRDVVIRQTIQCRMVGVHMMKELEMIWKEAVVT